MTPGRSSRAALWLVALVAGLGAAAACFDVHPARPVLGYETGDQACDDGLDNDLDGLVDCDDDDCFELSVHCGEIVPEGPFVPIPVEQTPAHCSDRIDNDDDGFFDCHDRSCQNIPETCCSREFTDAACSDGLDNDGNGFTDCEDFSCSRGLYVTVCRRLPTPTPTPSPAVTPTTTPTPVTRTPEDSLATCFDALDNDLDGFTDCNDFSCSRATDPAIVSRCAERAEDTLEKCSDGVDNDGNNFTDCNDFSCSRSRNPDVLAYCAEQGESTYARCTDGIDNDGNGFVDCDDFGCTRGEMAVRQACQESLAATAAQADERCADGLDNDADGFIDCQDWDCAWNPQVTVCAGVPRACDPLSASTR